MKCRIAVRIALAVAFSQAVAVRHAHGGSTGDPVSDPTAANGIACSIKITEIMGLRKPAVGNFNEADPDEAGRLFVDTKEDWNGGPLVKAHYDKQRVKITVKVIKPTTIPSPSNYRILWELYDPDDPATDGTVDRNGARGGDNTGTVHEGDAAGWFAQADHALDGTPQHPHHSEYARAPQARSINENTVIGSAKTVITNVGGENISTIFFNFTDDGGDNFKVRARFLKGNDRLCSDETKVLTVWRKRFIKVYAMEKSNDDIEEYPPGTTDLTFSTVCVKPGPNLNSDTLELGGDDMRAGHFVVCGPNKTAETTANSGGNSFDPQATQALFHTHYAQASANHLPYIDFVVTSAQFDRLLVWIMNASDIHAYMFQHTNFKTHPDNTYSVLGAYVIQNPPGQPVPANALYVPHFAISVWKLWEQAVAHMFAKTNIHEVGHLLIKNFENDTNFHTTHLGNVCGFMQGDYPPRICPRHARLLRDRVSRSFGTQHQYGGVSNDSAQSP